MVIRSLLSWALPISINNSNIKETVPVGHKARPLPYQKRKAEPYTNIFGYSKSTDKLPEYINEILLKPYSYQSANSSKANSFKPLIEAFNIWLQVPEERLEMISNASVLLYHAAIMIDDIQDNSSFRDGELAAHAVFGVAQTLNCANYICILALEEIRKLENPKAIEVFSEEMICLYSGQGMDVYWSDTLTCPTLKEFFEIGLDKTIGYIRLIVRLMQTESNSQNSYIGLVSKLGIHHQAFDDYISLQSEKNARDKGTFCEDIEGGKFSLPIVHSIQANPENSQELLGILEQRTKSIELKQRALQLLEKTDSLNYCRKFLENLEREIRNEIQKLGGNQMLEIFVKIKSVHDLK